MKEDDKLLEDLRKRLKYHHTIGDRIVFLRESMSMTQVKLADAIGITKMTLGKYEHNVNEPSISDS